MRVVFSLALVVCCAAGFAAASWWLDLSGRKHSSLEQIIAFQGPVVDRRMLKSGWSAPELWGVWSNGDRAELSLPMKAKPSGTVQIMLEADGFVAPPHFDRQVVKFVVNGSEIAELSFQGVTTEKNIVVPRDVALRRDPLHILLHIASPRSPAELGLGSDTRKLGIGLRTLTLSYSVSEIVDN